MFRTKFKVKSAGELRTGTKTERDANGNDVQREWKVRDVLLEVDNPEAWLCESVALTLLGEDVNLALSPGMEVEVTLFFKARNHNGRNYNDVDYKNLRVC